jgi:hypothetical protein
MEQCLTVMGSRTKLKMRYVFQLRPKSVEGRYNYFSGAYIVFMALHIFIELCTEEN